MWVGALPRVAMDGDSRTFRELCLQEGPVEPFLCGVEHGLAVRHVSSAYCSIGIWWGKLLYLLTLERVLGFRGRGHPLKLTEGVFLCRVLFTEVGVCIIS